MFASDKAIYQLITRPAGAMHTLNLEQSCCLASVENVEGFEQEYIWEVYS